MLEAVARLLFERPARSRLESGTSSRRRGLGTKSLWAVGDELVPRAMLEDPIQARQRYAVAPRLQLSEDLSPAHRPRARSKHREDRLDGPRRDAVHTKAEQRRPVH